MACSMSSIVNNSCLILSRNCSKLFTYFKFQNSIYIQEYLVPHSSNPYLVTTIDSHKNQELKLLTVT